MTFTELKALLATMPDASAVSVVVQEYERAAGYATAAPFTPAPVQVHHDELLLIANVEVGEDRGSAALFAVAPAERGA